MPSTPSNLRREHRCRAPLASAIVLAALPLAISQAYAGQVTSVWNGGSGSYGTAAAWNTGVVPLNDGINSYIVEIFAGGNVTYSILGPQQIDGFLLDANTQLTLNSTSLIAPTSLTVLGSATIGGSITANGASFSALAAGTSFVGNTVRLSATGGGTIAVGATAYNGASLVNATLLNAAGAGSLLDLHTVQTFNVGTTAAGSYGNTVSAGDSGVINLSGVKSIVAPSGNSGTQTLTFSASGGGAIDLSSLQTVQGLTTDSGYTSFVANGGTIALGPLHSANRMLVDLQNGSTMTAGGYSGNATLTNSTFSAASGSTLNAATLVGTFGVKGLVNQTVLSAAGAGSLLDLSGLTTFDVGTTAAGSYGDTVSASDGGVIKLSSVKNIIAPTGNSGTQTLTFNVAGGSQLDLSSLQTVQGVTADSGYTSFNVNGGTVDLGPLHSANRLDINLQNGSTMTAGAYNGTAITNSLFWVSGGSQLDAGSLVGSFAAKGLVNQTILSASGAGSSLDLAGLQTLDVGTTAAGSYGITVAAADSGVIDLSGVKNVIAPTGNSGTQTLTFSASGGGAIKLSSLQSVSGVTTDSGYTSFAANGGSFDLGSLQSANRMGVNLQNASTMTIGAVSGASLTNSTFAASGNSQLHAGGLIGSFGFKGLTNQTVLSAAGSGSLLDLSGLTTIDGGTTTAGSYNNTIAASDGGVIKLSGVKNIIAPIGNSGTQTLMFNASSGGKIDLSSVQTVQGVALDSGYTSFNANAGAIALGPLQSANRMLVNLQSGSTMTAGGFAGAATITNSMIAASGGSKLNAASLVGSFGFKGLTNQTVLSAAGSGSLLDLSGLTTIDGGTTTAGSYNNTIAASDGGVIKLSGVKTIIAPIGTGGTQTLVFSASSNGVIDLSSLQTITSAGTGHVQFNVSSGSSLTLGGVSAGPGTQLAVADAGSTLGIGGTLSLQNGSTLSAGTGTRIDIAGNYSFAQTVASQVVTDLATFSFDTAGPHLLEVGGKDNGLPTGTATVTGNFAIGELQVGQAGVKSGVQLVNQIANLGTAAGVAAMARAFTPDATGTEALYLNDGLQILGGSTLALNGIDLYVEQSGQWTSINGLFGNGQTVIAYGQGFIAKGVLSAVPEPSTVALLLAGLGFIGLRRRSSRR